jgi:hypothetical protein
MGPGVVMRLFMCFLNRFGTVFTKLLSFKFRKRFKTNYLLWGITSDMPLQNMTASIDALLNSIFLYANSRIAAFASSESTSFDIQLF